MDFQIAIPTYQRARKVKECSLAYLSSQGIDPDCITLFLKNNEEYNLYSEELSGVRLVVCHTQTLNDKKTFINQYYPLGTKVLNLDDDIRDMVFLDPEKRFLPVMTRMFELLVEHEMELFGVYPTHTTNKFYLKDRVAIGHNFCIGQCSGFINTGRVFPTQFCGKEDKWLSLVNTQTKGGSLRYEGVSCKTTNNAKGGLSEFRKTADIQADAKALAAAFPELCSYKVKKHTEGDVIFTRLPRRFRDLFVGV